MVVRARTDEDEHHVVGRLFQHLEQGVGGVAGEEVGLGDDEHAGASFVGAQVGGVDDVAHRVDADGRCVPAEVDEAHVGVVALGDAGATRAHAARGRIRVAVQGLRELDGEGRLAQVRGAGEEVGVVEAALCQ